MSKLALGLDIGSSHVKLAGMAGRGTGLRLTHFGLMALPTETIVDEELLNSAALVSTIRELLADMQVRRRDVAIALGGRAVIIRQISLPSMTEHELEESLSWEAKQYIPFDLDEIYLDFHMGAIDPDTDQMAVTLVAAKRTVVDDYCAAVRLAGLNPVVVDVTPFAVSNAFTSAYPEYADETVAVVDVGANLSTVAVVEARRLVYSRSNETGAHRITDKLQRELAIPFAQAEAFKTGGSGGLVPVDVQRILKESTAELSAEIHTMINHHVDSGGTPVGRMVVSGGGALSATLIESLANRLGVHCEAANPFRQATMIERTLPPLETIEASAPQAMVCAGLAQRSGLDRLQASRERKK
jgi:type IV pilus assembly protein PilM